MRNRSIHRILTVIVAVFAAGIALGAPAYADPISGNTTTVEMPTPGAGQSFEGGSPYQSPPVTVAVQAGGGVDRDGTDGTINVNGTQGGISGPLLRAVPPIRAKPAPLSPRIRS